MAIEMHNLLVLSTAHVSPEMAKTLQDTPLEEWPIAGGPHGQVGWFMYAHDEDVEGNIGPELMEVFRFARLNGCSYVLFDRDADYIDKLPTWEW